VAPQIAGKFAVPLVQNSLLFFGSFLISGMLLGKLARMALDDTVGSAGIGDRIGGKMLGAVRISKAGQLGFKSLPPEVTAAIDRLKQERRI
jgi:membrane protein required for colicin V production